MFGVGVDIEIDIDVGCGAGVGVGGDAMWQQKTHRCSCSRPPLVLWRVGGIVVTEIGGKVSYGRWFGEGAVAVATIF